MLDKLERLGRDVALKVHFAGEEGLDMDGSELFVKSSWMRPNPPLQVYSRLETFDSKLRSLFIKRKVNSNLSKFQEGPLDSIRNDDHHIIATADKGLGPVRVEVPRYIKDALVHLSNTETYQIISEEQGKRDIIDLE
jgi:hypothetical protein